MLVAQEEVEIVRNLLSELVPSTESLNSLLLLLLNTGSSLLFIVDGIFTYKVCNLLHKFSIENKKCLLNCD